MSFDRFVWDTEQRTAMHDRHWAMVSYMGPYPCKVGTTASPISQGRKLSLGKVT